jgi:hypothetical protein
MKTVKIAVLLSMAWLWGCASTHVVTDKNQSINFASYKTYAWLQPEQTGDSILQEYQLLNRHITSITDYELNRRGMVKDSLQPDLHFSYSARVEQKDKTVTKRSNLPAAPIITPRGTAYWGPWLTDPTWTAFMHRPHTEAYTEGTLILNVIDPSTEQVIWSGQVSEEVDNPKRLQRDITRSVEAILKKLPVSVAQNERNAANQ